MRRLVLAMLLVASPALGNGRAPLTNGMHFKPGDPQSLYVATTFGLLVSHDDGCTFQWVCEQNIGYGGQWDPKYGIAPDGTIYATTFTGLRVSRDGGCSFSTVVPDIWIDALDIGPSGEIWVGTAESGKPNDVLSSTDQGHTFQSRGMMSPTIWWKSVKVAPSNAQRVYITGYQVAGTYDDGGLMPPTPHLFRSDDDGAHWTESPLTNVQFGMTPIVHVFAVDPQNADVIYMVSDLAAPPNGDRLYRSTDGGATFTEVLATSDSVHDVVIADAQHVYVTTLVTSGMTLMGGKAYVSSDGGASFGSLAGAPQLSCLARRDDGALYGCAANWAPDNKAITKSVDGGATWDKVWRFVQLQGPLSCPDGTAERDTCDLGLWENLKAQFGTTGPTCGAYVGGGDPPPPVKKPKGCCDAGDGAPAGLALLSMSALFRRRRSRPSAS